jgi:hypothetical protein
LEHNIEKIGGKAIAAIKKHPYLLGGMVIVVGSIAYLMAGSSSDTGYYAQDTSGLGDNDEDIEAADASGFSAQDLADLFAALESDTADMLAEYTAQNQAAMQSYFSTRMEEMMPYALPEEMIDPTMESLYAARDIIAATPNLTVNENAQMSVSEFLALGEYASTLQNNPYNEDLSIVQNNDNLIVTFSKGGQTAVTTKEASPELLKPESNGKLIGSYNAASGSYEAPGTSDYVRTAAAMQYYAQNGMTDKLEAAKAYAQTKGYTTLLTKENLSSLGGSSSSSSKSSSSSSSKSSSSSSSSSSNDANKTYQVATKDSKTGQISNKTYTLKQLQSIKL